MHFVSVAFDSNVSCFFYRAEGANSSIELRSTEHIWFQSRMSIFFAHFIAANLSSKVFIIHMCRHQSIAFRLKSNKDGVEMKEITNSKIKRKKSQSFGHHWKWIAHEVKKRQWTKNESKSHSISSREQPKEKFQRKEKIVVTLVDITHSNPLSYGKWYFAHWLLLVVGPYFSHTFNEWRNFKLYTCRMSNVEVNLSHFSCCFYPSLHLLCVFYWNVYANV